MATTTSPDGLVIPTGTDQIAPLQATLAAMQNSVQAAFVARNQLYAPTVANASERDSVFPNPVQGNRVYRADRGFMEAYYTTYSAATNPGGAIGGAGWYPAESGFVTARATRQDFTIASDTQRRAITLDTWEERKGASFSFSNGGIVLPYTGQWQLRGRVNFGTSDNGTRWAAFNRNGTTLSIEDSRPAVQGGNATYVTITDNFNLSAGDYVHIALGQNSGANMALVSPAGDLSVSFIRP